MRVVNITVNLSGNRIKPPLNVSVDWNLNKNIKKRNKKSSAQGEESGRVTSEGRGRPPQTWLRLPFRPCTTPPERGGKKIQGPQPIREGAQEQRKEETRGNSISEFLEGLRRKLEEEKEKEVRGILKMRMKIQNLKRYLEEGSGGAYQQIQRESLERYEKHRTECSLRKSPRRQGA